ncbi:MAG: lysoplasmalogenase [Anaerolineae bacterium]|jgi:uncharacterized membrane protein YhhN|nr:lysoplasmalogenase [Anaerolineae bacterium]
MAPIALPAFALGLGLVLAVVDWIAVTRESRRLEYAAKPATLVAIIVGTWLLALQTGGGWLAWWFVAALTFSLLGDILLMLPGDRWFPLGLGAFLVAQLCYVLGLSPTLPPVGSLWLVIVIIALDLCVLPRIVCGARDRGSPELRAPVVVYGVVLSLTLFSGWATWFRPSWSTGARLLASAGVTLFFSSDLMLAWNRFVRPSKVLAVAVIVTYHLAQLALALVVGASALW